MHQKGLLYIKFASFISRTHKQEKEKQIFKYLRLFFLGFIVFQTFFRVSSWGECNENSDICFNVVKLLHRSSGIIPLPHLSSLLQPSSDVFHRIFPWSSSFFRSFSFALSLLHSRSLPLSDFSLSHSSSSRISLLSL